MREGIGKIRNSEPISRVSQKRTVQGYYDGVIGSRICAFNGYQNHRPWMTLNGDTHSAAEKMCLRAYCKNLNEIDPLAAKM